MSILLKSGLLRVKWYFNGSSLIYEIEVPKNVTAKVILVDGRNYTVKEGKYTFSMEYSEN